MGSHEIVNFPEVCNGVFVLEAPEIAQFAAGVDRQR